MPEYKDKGLFRLSLSITEKAAAHAAVFLAGLLKFALRLTGRAGTALPGKTALRLQPRLLSYLTAGRKVYLVTGTNGKTTTVRILCTLLAEQGFDVVTNPSGANLDSGLTTTLIDNRKLLKSDSRHKTVLVFEIDEAFFAKLAGILQPSVCVVTNFFRDQLDRYGELQHTRDLIDRGLEQTNAQIVLCADDSLCASLGSKRESVSRYFGMNAADMKPASGSSVLESGFCTFCGSRYSYDAMAYGHLGLFRCDECGFFRPQPELMFSIAVEEPADPQSQLLDLTWQAKDNDAVSSRARLFVPGVHNAYNASGAMLAAIAGGSRFEDLAESLSKANAAFGRMERFTVEDKDVCLILVKNPVGMDRALDYVATAGDAGAHMLLLNANDPDGRDVSWIWDVDFENRLPAGKIGVSGVRRYDMALRLIYAGKEKQDLLITEDAMQLFDQCLADCPPGKCLYILPNYTCMLDLRANLVKRYGLRNFWL